MNITSVRRSAPILLSVAFALCSLATRANDPTPASGTLSPTSPSVTFTAGPFPLTNESYSTPVGGTCSPGVVFRCDDFSLTVELPDDYDTTHPDDKIVATFTWDNVGDDMDFYLLDDDGNEVTNNQAATGQDPEVAIFKAGKGTYHLTVRTVPYRAQGDLVSAKIELVTPPPVVTGPPPLAPTGTPPRFYVYAAQQGVGDGGEPSIGYNPATKRAMYIATGGGTGPAGLGGQILQINFPENLDAPMPEACDADWVDVTPTEFTVVNIDGILVTDQSTGRTFASELLSVGPALLGLPGGLEGFNSIFAFSDDDGASWTPGQIGPPQTSIPPPILGTVVADGLDHQSVGFGPYVEGTRPATATYPNAVYYCSQGYVQAFCTRSDDGGLTFPSIGAVVYTEADDGCGGLHGHIRVAPDGTAYLPNRNCHKHAAVAVSEDSGNTWEVREQPDSSNSSSDPQMALATDGTGYFCWVGADGHPHVTVTDDKAKTWINDYDIGYYQGIQNAVFPQAIAGDPDRAACFFLGTTTPGNLEAMDFPGIWYPFVATTYDHGKTWHTVNVSPNDPVQREGGIWLHGGGNSNRNLLDFNEVTTDELGRVLAIYADGCIGPCVQEGPNSFSAHATMARLIGGRPLFAANDPVEPVKPLGACLFGQRDQYASHLTWRTPDSGGADIASYRIYRGTSPDAMSLLTETPNAKPRYTDLSADPGVDQYTYKITAVNSQGEGVFSNIITLPVNPIPPVESPCTVPGVTLTNDPTGDNTNGPPGTDLLQLSVAEPKDMEGMLVFTMKVDSLPPSPESGFRWVTYFELPNPPGNGDLDYYVAMETGSGTPHFEFGTHVAQAVTGVGLYHSMGDLDAASGFSPDGTIVLVLDKSKLDQPMNPGDQLSAIHAATRTSAPGSGQGLTLDGTDNFGYTLRGPQDCVVARGPLANLIASATSGDAPLHVDFDGSSSSDPDGIAIASYTFNFGDGSDAVTQQSPDISHTYLRPGNYPATLTVKNAQGASSTNTSRVLINVGGSGGTAGGGDRTRFGGALGLPLLLVFTGLAALRRRRLQLTRS
ncbi:MAG TPA: PKD domain-containing protein [Nevskiaceae bacterium]|nr:PKD domain-containing protein [Nevskiaceae bacterium]